MDGSLLNRKLSCNSNSREAGFTLIEVMVALTIFAIGLLALAGMQITGIKGNSRAQSVSAKVALGSGVIEEIMALNGDADFLKTDATIDPWQIVDIAGSGTCNVAVTVDANPTIGATTYTGLTRIVVTTASPNGNPVTQTIMKRRY